MPAFDTVIKGGMLVDGTLVPPYKADLGIKKGASQVRRPNRRLKQSAGSRGE